MMRLTLLLLLVFAQDNPYHKTVPSRPSGIQPNRECLAVWKTAVTEAYADAFVEYRVDEDNFNLCMQTARNAAERQQGEAERKRVHMETKNGIIRAQCEADIALNICSSR